MYERVWSGAEHYPDDAQWDLALEFDQETGLFFVGQPEIRQGP